MADRVKLTEAQTEALGWPWCDGSFRSWGGKDCGHPSIATLDALVRKGLMEKRGGNGCPVSYAITPAGHALLASDAGKGR